MTGLRLSGKGVLRTGQKVFSNQGEGMVTSGTYSPTLKASIGLARVPFDFAAPCDVEIRGKYITAEPVKYPFVRNGKVLI
jgi:aminomethyltransferase